MESKYHSLTYEDLKNSQESYLVDYQCEEGILVISFSFYEHRTTPGFDSYGRLKQIENITGKKINKLLLRDTSNLWYHHGIKGLGADVDQCVAEIKNIIAKIKPLKIYTMGHSMGAYAAILFGTLLGVNNVISFAPLAFFDTKKLLLCNDSRWEYVVKGIEKKPPKVFYNDLRKVISQSRNRPQIDIYYGSYVNHTTNNDEVVHLDTLHAMMLEDFPNVNLLHFPYSCHLIGEYLKKAGLLNSILIKTLFNIEHKEEPPPLEEGWIKWIKDNISAGFKADKLAIEMSKSNFSYEHALMEIKKYE